MESANEPASEVERVRRLTGEKVPFARKIEDAAKIIPASLRPGGANPFHTIFGVLSDGLHGRSEPECCDLVDALTDSMALLFANLNHAIESQKTYSDAVKKVEALRRPRS
jgi:hypothetical protein